MTSNTVIYVLIAVALIAGFAFGWLIFHGSNKPDTITQVIEKPPVIVDLTRQQIDSLQLSMKKEFAAKFRVVARKDSARADSLKRAIFSLQDSLALVASYTLEYRTDSLGKYGDTLSIIANIPNSLFFVDFRPRDRKIELPARLDSIVYVPYPQPDAFYDHPTAIGIIAGLGIVAGVLIGTQF